MSRRLSGVTAGDPHTLEPVLEVGRGVFGTPVNNFICNMIDLNIYVLKWAGVSLEPR